MSLLEAYKGQVEETVIPVTDISALTILGQLNLGQTPDSTLEIPDKTKWVKSP